MSIINKEISEFKTYAFHENEFKTVSKDDRVKAVYAFCNLHSLWKS